MDKTTPQDSDPTWGTVRPPSSVLVVSFDGGVRCTVVTSERLAATLPGTAAAEAEELVGRVAEDLGGRYGISVETAVLAGDPAGELVSLAGGTSAVLLALGSRGNGAFRRLAFGSVSTAALHDAPGAVLVTHGGLDT